MVSRYHQLLESINEYFDCLGITYSIHSLTENPRCNTQYYHIKIPHEILLYNVDVPFIEGNTEIPSGPVYRDMNIEENRQSFIEQFDKYFDEFKWSEDGRMVSFMKLDMTDFSGRECVFLLHVLYFKKHCPFPTDLNLDEQHIENLNKQIKEYEKKIVIMTNNHNSKMIEINDAMSHQKKRFDEMVRTIYIRSGKKEECPICYEIICADRLFVPQCCHFLCSDCGEKCQMCPLCRKVF